MLNVNYSVIYDIETFPNCFTLSAIPFDGSHQPVTWEISDRRDDRNALLAWFNWLNQTNTLMVGFNNIHFDYPVVHYIWQNPNCTVEAIYQKAMSIIQGGDRFNHMVWADNRFAPQLDLFKMNHFDNVAKATSLKWLQINMRSSTVVDMPVENGTILSSEHIEHYLKPYNVHDVERTKDFMEYCSQAVTFRVGLIEQFGIDVLNWNDTKIGEQMVISRLGEPLCYDNSTGRKKPRQTPRYSIALADIIFPYVRFEHPEFNRVLSYLKSQVLKHDELDQFASETPVLKTKGVFKDLKASVGGIEFHFGVGGIHGSVEKKRFQATDEWLIQDIDVAALYPSIAIRNQLAPAHLGNAFVGVYSELPKERKRWQTEKGKKCVEANALKLASNGVYGKSNSKFSPFYDPQFTMTITVNGQLLLCMLAEQLMKVPTLQIIQINTDGITYVIHKSYDAHARSIWKWWEELTGLVLEDVLYRRMFIRDVNSYIAEGMDGSLKLKGAYWTPDPLRYHESISEAQPPAWHKNLSNAVSTRAAVAAMLYGIDPRTFIGFCTNPYDFTCAVKANRGTTLVLGGQKVQRTCRYFVSRAGGTLVKVAPPKGVEGAYKKANGVSDAMYQSVMRETGGQWDGRVCTKNKSKYEMTKTAVVANYNVTLCNNISDFDFSNINYDWYVAEAMKLIV